MPADELGSIYSSDPVRVSQAIKPVGKELDRERKEHENEGDLPPREDDSVELSAEHESDKPQPLAIKENSNFLSDSFNLILKVSKKGIK